jgi:hypothetical protein
MSMRLGHASVVRSIQRTFAPRVLLVALVAIAPLTLTTLAHASPPDPSWLQGIYDDADYDDVVALLTSETGEVQAAPAERLPILLSTQRVAEPPERVGPIVAVSATRSRAPPSS